MEKISKEEEADQQLWGDEEGGGGCADGQRCEENPVEGHGPSQSKEEVFAFSAVAVDSVPCATIGR